MYRYASAKIRNNIDYIYKLIIIYYIFPFTLHTNIGYYLN